MEARSAMVFALSRRDIGSTRLAEDGDDPGLVRLDEDRLARGGVDGCVPAPFDPTGVVALASAWA